MPVITGIVPAADRPGHVVILVDGTPFATVPADALARVGAEPGAPASAVESLGPMDRATERTWERALNVLAYRARTAQELRERLIEKGEEPARVDAVIVRLRAHGYLDDGAFAESRARTQVVGRARAPRRVREDLARRGVERAVADAAIAAALDEAGTSERAVAEQAARKKLKSLSNLPPREQRQKLFGYLARQGYPLGVVRAVVGAVLAAAPGDEGDDPGADEAE